LVGEGAADVVDGGKVVNGRTTAVEDGGAAGILNCDGARVVDGGTIAVGDAEAAGSF